VAKRSTSDLRITKITIANTRKGVEIKEDGKTFAVLPLASRELAEAFVRFGATRSQIIWLLHSED
jgi:hypothetical protein